MVHPKGPECANRTDQIGWPAMARHDRPAWDLAVGWRDDEGVPLFVRVARGLSDAITAGRLRAGSPLPGSRTLARTLGVHRNTVLAAYAELGAEGWIVATPARGTRVADAIPDVRPRAALSGRTGVPARAGFGLREPGVRRVLEWPTLGPGVLDLSRAVPDLRSLPLVALGRALR